MSEDAHARPTRDAPEPLYNVNIPTPTHAERARTLVAESRPGPVHPGPGAGGLSLRLVRDRRL